MSVDALCPAMLRCQVLMLSPESHNDLAVHIAGAGSMSAAGMPQDQVFQLLSAAVYSAAEDPQRQHSFQQLCHLTSRLQEPPGPTNDVAVFSNRCVMIQPVRYNDLEPHLFYCYLLSLFSMLQLI